MCNDKINNESPCIKRQCVAFSRRWLYVNRGLIYNDVEIAADIWEKVSFYIRVSDGKAMTVASIKNGSTQQPLVGDLIIYSKQYFNTGHVAVVTAIDEPNNCVLLNEQNFNNQYHSPCQQRIIPLIQHEGNYWLLDNNLIGWKHLQEEI